MRDPNVVIDWLLEDADIAVKYRTLVDVLDKTANDPEVRAAHRAVQSSPEVIRIFSKRNQNGLWPHTPKNFASYTTTYYLMALAEQGLDKNDERISRIVTWYLKYLETNKDVYCAFMPVTLRALAMLGYGNDKKIKPLIDAYIKTIRFDGGYLCDWKRNKYKGTDRLPKSCFNISAQTLLLYAYLSPSQQSSPACKKLVEYFFKRRVLYKNDDPHKIIVTTKSSFPVYMPVISLYHILYALSVLGYGRRKELSDAWSLLKSKQDRQGKYALEKTPSKKIFSVGKINEPNKWVTFYICLAEKYKNSC